MPRHTVDINLKELAEGEALATLISYVAYPQVKSEKDRLAFLRALYREALKRKATVDAAWAITLQPIRISNILDSNQLTGAEFRRARQKFDEHMLMSTHFLPPNLGADESKNHTPRLPNGEKPTVENTVDYVKRRLGRDNLDTSTFKHDVWRPTKLICHLALALSNAITAFKHHHPASNLFYELFFEDDFVISVLRNSEKIRLQMAKKPKLRLQEHSTLQFYSAPETPKRLRFAKLP